MSSRDGLRVPFIWSSREHSQTELFSGLEPPYCPLIEGSHWLFGIVPAPTGKGIAALTEWLRRNPVLKASLVVVVYPTCSTLQSNLEEIVRLLDCFPSRLFARILPLEGAVDRSLQVLCFSVGAVNQAFMVVGSTEDFGLARSNEAHTNLVFRPDPGVVDVFRDHFDLLWEHSYEFGLLGVSEMPELALAPGSGEAALAWQAYQNSLCSASLIESAQATGTESRHEPASEAKEQRLDADSKLPTALINVPKRDELARAVSDIYERGALVTISKLTRIPPLDSPIDPRIFGDRPELRRGSVTRKVNMRVSVIDEEMLKQIEDCRRSVSALLPKFSLALADGARWMPIKVRPLFEAELEKIQEKGRGMISDLLKGDVEKFIAASEKKLRTDLDEMYAELGHQGSVPQPVMDKIIGSLVDRLRKAANGNFVPEISYSPIAFREESTEFSNSWGQASSLLAEIAIYPRKAAIDRFFDRGLNTPLEKLSSAMDVAGDALHKVQGVFHASRCKTELELIAAIREAAIESRTRCELIFSLIQGAGADEIQRELIKVREQTGQEENDSDKAAAGADFPKLTSKEDSASGTSGGRDKEVLRRL